MTNNNIAITERNGFFDGIRSERPASGGARVTVAQLHRVSKAKRDAYLRGFRAGAEFERRAKAR